jgi:Flavodoxin reductases (ferredoxin-NADPH reductases) family 1
MQPLIDAARAGAGGRLSLFAGLLLMGALFFWCVVEIARLFQRMHYARQQQRSTLECLRAQLQSIQARSQEADQNRLVWNGYRKFSVTRKVSECDDVCAFYLKPHDGKPLPAYKPGQYLTFQLDIPGRDKPLVRCYSLSDSPLESQHYRVTIKKEKAPADKPELPNGVVSSFFCDSVKEGDILNVKAPTGHFFLDMAKNHPIVLIAGGVGVTPMLSMAKAIVASGSKREAWFFYGVRNRREHIHLAELQALAAENENIQLHVCYSKPSPEDVKGTHYNHEGRVSIELLKEILPSNNFDYYLCGNGAFMKSITEGLEAWGVPEKDIYFEAFGPATVKKKTAQPSPSETVHMAKMQVTFGRSNKTVRWEPALGNLLDFAREQGVRIDSGCCAGSCGSAWSPSDRALWNI